MTLPRRLLIANRGEIACRIARTARRLGIATIAVFSDADTDALHVRACDEAVRIGGAAPADSYLKIGAILAAAQRSGADAVHPGYGFLSENAAFAEACPAAGLVFVGPPPAAIRAMGSKAEARARMALAGVPVTPGYHGEDQDPALLQSEAERLGYPVVIKASAGGGGKGMRRVDRPEDFQPALMACRREAAAGFGDERMLVERYVLRPRHIEMQVFADTRGGIVHLFERDCSVQRRHQKVLEEAPAPGVGAARREAMGRAAIEAARAVGYVGAGTVEFIVAPDGAFYFMEMNTRLQVEHPVTEMITGIDLVEWQLRVAGGEPLPLPQSSLRIDGHAIEARIYAEDPERGFLPSSGTLQRLAFPPPSAGLRVDAGVVEGGIVTPHYDPMIAKLVVHGETRQDALRRLQQALARCRIVGVENNVAFLARLVQCPSFVSADLDTALIEREAEALFPPAAPPPRQGWLAVAAAWLAGEPDPADALGCEPVRRGPESGAAAMGRFVSPWEDRSGWRVGEAARRELLLRSGAYSAKVAVQWSPQGWWLELEGLKSEVHARWHGPGQLELEIDGHRSWPDIVRDGSVWHLFRGASRVRVDVHDPLALRAAGAGRQGDLRAPMPGRIVSLIAEVGRDYARGAPLLVLEAMKMEHTIVAPADGRLGACHVALGDQVEEGTELFTFEDASGAARPARSTG